MAPPIAQGPLAVMGVAPAVLDEVLLELELGVTVTVTGMVAVLLLVEVTLTAM